MGMMLGGPFPEMPGAVAGLFLSMAVSLQKQKSQEEGEAFDDLRKSQMLLDFASHCPSVFFLSIPQIIDDNVLLFDDEDVLESTILQCLDALERAGEQPDDKSPRKSPASRRRGSHGADSSAPNTIPPTTHKV